MGRHFQRRDGQPGHLGCFLQRHFLDLQKIDSRSLDRRQTAERLGQAIFVEHLLGIAWGHGNRFMLRGERNFPQRLASVPAQPVNDAAIGDAHKPWSEWTRGIVGMPD